MEKKISVVMCTYNGALFLKDQLDSILNQTYPIFELIIQDDCSTDDTLDILEFYSKKYSNVFVHLNTYTMGVNRNFFSAIKRATGDYIAISDQDDIWELDKIETQVNQIGNKLLSSGFSRPFVSDEDVYIHFDRRIPNCSIERMIYIGVTPGHTMLFKKELVNKIPNIEKWYDLYTYDKTLQIVAASYGSVQFCDKILVNNRRHKNAVTYTPPLDYRLTLSNIFRSIYRTLRLYKRLRPQMREYFYETYLFLNDLYPDAKYKKEAISLALYQSSSSFISYLKLTYLCVKLRHKLFYSSEQRNKILCFFRAVYFPISSSDYFRYLIK